MGEVAHDDAECVAHRPAHCRLLPLEDIDEVDSVVDEGLDHVAEGAREHEPEVVRDAVAKHHTILLVAQHDDGTLIALIESKRTA